MKYDFTVYDKKTNNIIFQETVSGHDKAQCASTAAAVGRAAGIKLVAAGKSIRYAGDLSPYKFKLKQINYNYLEHERKITE